MHVRRRPSNRFGDSFNVLLCPLKDCEEAKRLASPKLVLSKTRLVDLQV